MRKILLALTAIVILCATSCTKEKSFEEENPNGSGGNATDGELLSKIVVQLGPDSATTTFNYDLGKRLVSETNVGGLSIASDDSLQRVVRDANGIIQKIVLYPDAGLNNLVEYTLRYDAAAKRYTTKLSYDGNGNVEDSIVYTYDNAGRITGQTAYVNFGGGYEVVGKETIEYDGNNNIRKVTAAEPDGTMWEDIQEVTFEYDDKVNPLKLGVEAVLLNRQQYHGNNNVTRIAVEDFDLPMFNQEITLTYTYNGSNKPLTAAITISGAGGATLPVTFKYK